MEDKDIPECRNNLAQSHHSSISQEVANTTYNTELPTSDSLSTSSNIQIANFTNEGNQFSPKCLQSVAKDSTQAATSQGLQFQSRISVHNRPQSLFLQALSKLNENTLSCVLNDLIHYSPQNTLESSKMTNDPKLGELRTPDSLTSAPPSYSFVLRQMAARRPRLMGTFIPSPSFVLHTPPPNYATAFDIYVDPIPPPRPPRTYTFGFTSMPVVCPECGYTGMTEVRSKITLCTHMCSLVLCVLCCWVCAPLPYIMQSCKEVYHYCRNCRQYLGRYCPTSAENRYP